LRKALSEREQNAIKEKLIQNCRICWERYGYKKTGVAELAAMSGISTGSFYSFFPSKEVLFLETVNDFTKNLYDIMERFKPENPTLKDFASGFKKCTDEMFENKWIFSLREDASAIMRKMPVDFLEKDFRQDLIDITTIVNLYGLKAKVPMEEIVAVFHTIIMSIYITDIIGSTHRQALNLLIDSVIVDMFE
jgi:Transcriptional regulator